MEYPYDDETIQKDLNMLHQRRRKNPLIHKIKSDNKLPVNNGAHDWSKQVEEEKPSYMIIKDETYNAQTFYNGSHGDF